LYDQFHLHYSLNGVYQMMKCMRMCWISAGAISPQADLHAQAEFKKMFVLNVQSVVPPHVRSDCIDTWFQDEMRIGQRGTQGSPSTGSVLAEIGAGYIFDAVCPR
jgi:hypothetical protein